MSAFESIQIVSITLASVGNNAMWDAAMQVLPMNEIDENRPVIVRVTDGKCHRICITRLNGVPTLVESSVPYRFNEIAIRFQASWNATDVSKQVVTSITM